MADYYPILARAVSKLPSDDTQARRDLYAHARTVVGQQLRRGGRDGAADILREQAALEAAIGRIETEARAQIRVNGKAAVPLASRFADTEFPRPRPEPTARSLSKILQAVEIDEAAAGRPLKSRLEPRSVIRSPLPGIEQKSTPEGDQSRSKPPAGLGQAPNTVGTMLFGLSYVVAGLAFTGVTYIRCSVWIDQGVIGFPALLGVMAFTLALFIVPPTLIFRKTSSLPTIDSVWRFIYGRSRGLL